MKLPKEWMNTNVSDEIQTAGLREIYIREVGVMESKQQK